MNRLLNGILFLVLTLVTIVALIKAYEPLEERHLSREQALVERIGETGDDYYKRQLCVLLRECNVYNFDNVGSQIVNRFLEGRY